MPGIIGIACKPIRKRGFTLLEMIAVTGVLALLIGILLPVVTRSAARARQTKCKSNLRQFAVALNVYRADHRGANPDWLSTLYPEYIDTKALYICPADRSGGRDGGKPGPGDRYWTHSGDGSYATSAFMETYDIESNNHPGRNAEISRCSYLYEFSGAPCSLVSGYTWAEVKNFQMRTGRFDAPTLENMPDPLRPYSESRLPIIRCYHHWDEGSVPAHDPETGRRYNSALTINVGHAGNIFVAPLQWEHRRDGTE